MNAKRMKATLLTAILITSMLTALMQIIPVMAQETWTVSTWTDNETPIFGGEATSPGHDASEQCVIKISDTYYMYYTAPDVSGQNWIHYATSSDGIDWTEEGMASGQVHQYELNGLPSTYWAYELYPAIPWVLYDGATYHLYYSAAMNWVRHSTSTDGVTWTDQGLITIDTVDATFAGPITAYYDAGTYYAWFVSNGGSLFRIVSDDGQDWDTISTADSGRGDAYSGGVYYKNFGAAYGLTVTGYTDGGDNHQFTRVFVLKEGDNDYHMWFGGDKLRPHSSTWDKDIGYAVSEDGIEWTLENWVFSIDDEIDWRLVKTYSPQVIKEGNLYKMFYSGKDESDNYAIGHSTKLIDPDFTSIQPAIDAAQLGDTVLVYPGTYNEDVTIDKSLTLVSVEGKETTTINGQLGGQSAAVRVTDGVSDVFIGDTDHGFTINGVGQAAVILEATSGLTIRDNILVSPNSKPALETYGGQHNHIIQGNTFQGDASQLVYVNGLASVSVSSTNVDFFGNLFAGTATGPALGMEATDSEVSGNTFATVTGYASLELWGADNTVTGNDFTADLPSGGLYVMDSSVTYEIAAILSTNTFLRAVTVDNPGSSLLPMIWANIQDAIDTASAGDTVRVYPGTYEENIVILTSKDNLKLLGAGMENTILSPASGTAITVNSPVTIKGFHILNSGTAIQMQVTGASGTIENPGVIEANKLESPTESRGNGIDFKDYEINYWGIKDNVLINRKLAIYLNRASHLVISGNTLTGYKEGIGTNWNGEPAHDLTITGNDFLGTDYPFTPEELLVKAAIVLGEVSYNVEISGNTITGSPNGIWIPDSSDEPNLENVHINHNNIYDNTNYGILNEVSIAIDATLNFWGTIEESVIQGMVSEQVDYDPWFGQEPKIEETEPDDYTVDALDEADTIVEKTGVGTPTVSVAEFVENPETGFSNEAGKFYDVKIDSPEGVESLTLKFYYTDADLGGIEESTLSMKWHDGSSWITCTHQTLHTVSDVSGYSGYIEILVTDSTYPSLSDMTGTPFGFEGEFPEVYDELCDLSVSGDVIVEAAEDVTYVYASMGDTAEITVEMDLAGYHGDIYFTLYKKVDGGLAYVDEIRTVYGIELKGSRTASWVVTQSPGTYVIWINIDLMEKVQLTGLDEALHIGPIEVVIS